MMYVEISSDGFHKIKMIDNFDNWYYNVLAEHLFI